MKSYDQALNEIYQKAQQRADQRKKRNKIVLAILPVFCIVALTLAVIFLATPPATSDPGSDPVAPPSDSLQNEDPEDEPNKENPDEEDPNEENPNQEDNHPPVIEYLEVAPGKYVYMGAGGMESGGTNNNNSSVTYVLKDPKELGLNHGSVNTQEVVHEELKGTRAFDMLGTEVLLEYMYSKECVDEVSDEVKKYENIHVYRDERKSIYEFSAVTGQLVYYYKTRDGNVDSMHIGTDILCKMFVESQLGEGVLDSYEEHLGFSSGPYGSYYEYSFYKKIAGFNTRERIYVSVSDHRELQTYRIEYIGAYDEYIDNVTCEDITYTTKMVRVALRRAGIGMGGDAQTELLLDANGVLYVAVSFYNGTCYSEVLDADDVGWHSTTSPPEEENQG